MDPKIQAWALKVRFSWNELLRGTPGIRHAYQLPSPKNEASNSSRTVILHNWACDKMALVT
ncbi:unnamed protein product [Ectocarpus sp. 13 AM-2016]